MKRKHNVIILIFSIVFLLGIVGIMISMMQADRQSEYNTTDYSATVAKVKVTDTGENSYIAIQTEEFTSDLQISTNVSKYMGIDGISDLQGGQKIFFRIENGKISQLNHVEFVPVVSLKTEQKVIFSLDDYNRCIGKSAAPARIAGVILALLCLTVAILCIISINRRKAEIR